ncbi:MAG: hemerythrin domain-containing protein [Alphaproteobacteria bacterium]
MTAHRAALAWAALPLGGGLSASVGGGGQVAAAFWVAAIVPALALLVVSIGRSLRRGETDVDLIAGLAMAGALALGGHLAGAVERIVPHERADETALHPRLAPMLGGKDPMAAISRGHREIAHLARRLNRLIGEMRAEGPGPKDRADLRRVLHALEAILRLHFAQGEEIYDGLARG